MDCRRSPDTAKQGRIPPGCRAHVRSTPEPYTDTGWALEVIHEKTGIPLVFVPAGRFEMGSRTSAEEMARTAFRGKLETFLPEHPLHPVEVPRPFYIGKYEVTHAQYLEFVEKTGHDGPEEANDRTRWGYLKHLEGTVEGEMDEHPVRSIRWKDAQAYCQWAQLRLPTEIEWEYACRANTTTRYYFPQGTLDQINKHICCLPSGRKTKPVGQLEPNPWGLHDMLGNVAEWCEDLWHDSYEGAPSVNEAWIEGGDPERRVIRGGHFMAIFYMCRCATRFGVRWDVSAGVVGFRVVMDLPMEERSSLP